MRATLRLSSPAWFAQPRITSSTAAQSRLRMPLDERLDRQRREVVGAHARERAAVAVPNGSAQRRAEERSSRSAGR